MTTTQRAPKITDADLALAESIVSERQYVTDLLRDMASEIRYLQRMRKPVPYAARKKSGNKRLIVKLRNKNAAEQLQVPGLAVMLGVDPSLAYSKGVRLWDRPERELWSILERARACYLQRMREKPTSEVTTAWHRLRKIFESHGYKLGDN